MDNVRCLICSRRLKSQDSLLLHVKSAHLNAPNNTNKKAKRKPKRRNGNDNSDDRDDNGNGIDEIKKGDKDRNLIIIDDDDDDNSNSNIHNQNIKNIITTSTKGKETINQSNNIIEIYPQFPCEMCNASFSSLLELSNHIDSNHPEAYHPILITCPGCKEVNHNRYSFSRHKRLVHNMKGIQEDEIRHVPLTFKQKKGKKKKSKIKNQGPLNKVQHSNQTNNQTQNPHAIPNINSPGLNNNNNTYTNSGSLPHNNHINNFNPINNFSPFFNPINFNGIGESVTMQFTSTTGQVVSRSFIRCKICNMNCESDLAFSLHKRQAH
ncbi:5349_t:CDS:2 [Entrophospora sp. SA101]|nr:11038_t:CDS:2 [Entrophospora sp. SA101]CAJ0838940.1 15766_t:CDS:2 [Entrophospora sp. SA101]CAJ0903242.1 5349_t:CDS:2 [Entrophospora sp. SA101]